MSSYYPVADDDEVRNYRKDKNGNFYEVVPEEESEDE